MAKRKKLLPVDRFARMLVGRFDLQAQVKNRVAGHFFRDAYDWLSLYDANSGDIDYSTMSIATKRYLFLRFGVECALKSLIVRASKSRESASVAYQDARRPGHKLVNLYAAYLQKVGQIQGFLGNNQLEHLRCMDQTPVDIRYDLNLKTMYKEEPLGAQFSESGQISGGPVNIDFNAKSRALLVKLIKCCGNSNKRDRRHSGCLATHMGVIEASIRRLLQPMVKPLASSNLRQSSVGRSPPAPATAPASVPASNKEASMCPAVSLTMP